MILKQYTLGINRNKITLELNLQANNNNHAVAQAEDICRSLDVDSFNLQYGECTKTCVSNLFKKLAFNLFSQNICNPWTEKFSNSVPCLYAFRQRYYVRNIILKYLDIPKEGAIARPRCSCKSCINPYHFSYTPEKNTKLSDGDSNMLLAFLSQGSGVSQAATALKVHRSTIYRKLKHERLSSGTVD